MKSYLTGRSFPGSFVAGIVAAALLVSGLAGCSQPSFDNVMPSPKAESAVSDTGDATHPLSGTAAEESSNRNAAVPEQAIIVNGEATVISGEPSAAAKDFVSLVKEQGGKVDSTWESDTQLDHSSIVSARIPAEKYDDTLAQLSGFGKVERQWTDTADVSQQYVDLSARAKALQDSLVRLDKIAADATTTDELLKTEEMLTQRQAELDSLQQQLVWLEDQVAMSTLTVTFTTATTDPGRGFSLLRAWDVLLGSLSFLAYALIVMLPWVVIGAVTLVIIRVTIRRRRMRKQSAVESEAVSSFSDNPSTHVEHEATRAEE